MANSTVTVTVNAYPDGFEISQNKARLFGDGTDGKIAIGAGSYPVNGLPIDFSGLIAGINGDVVDARMSGVAGYIYIYDRTHGTIRIFQTGAALSGPLAEIATTTPAAVTTDAISYAATLNRVGGTEG